MHMKSHTKGFTLVETLVALSILLIVVVGPMTVAHRGIQNAYYANEQVAAVFLAQEAIEAVRATRDTDALGVYDADGVGDTMDWIPSGCSSGCAYIRETNDFGDCISNNQCVLKLDAGVYSHAGIGEDTQFTRTVTIGTPVTSGDVPVTVTVSWESTALGDRDVVLQTWMYDHYQRFEN